MQYLQLSLVACLHLRQRASGASSSHEPLGAEACEAAVLLLRRGLKRKLKAPRLLEAMPCRARCPFANPCLPPSPEKKQKSKAAAGRPAASGPRRRAGDANPNALRAKPSRVEPSKVAFTDPALRRAGAVLCLCAAVPDGRCLSQRPMPPRRVAGGLARELAPKPSC
ncbi:hypothetical protein ACCO45_009330 [Purpureocillium lilacinum]|uniref:Uncharacterized protein n=1 Tax=Purpureocillium lilacinum TaxID=33203 RepID=A0ACC4DKT9_PURLI